MNKLPKEIYVSEFGDVPMYYAHAEDAALAGETVTLCVYKLVGKVEVSTQIKQEVVVKKSKKPMAAKVAHERNPLLDEMQATLRDHQLASADTQ